MPSISIVIPVLSEQQRINNQLLQLRRQHPSGEIIVVDGDPKSSTLDIIGDPTITCLNAPTGRGSQLASGTAVATGDVILMLHADTELPDDGLAMISTAVAKGAVWGAFQLGIDAPGSGLRLIERGVDWRSRFLSLPYGDQGIFVQRWALEQLGGVPCIPIMEDVALVRSLRRQFGPCQLLPRRVKTSGSRWRREGISRRTLKNWWLLFRYLVGVAPEKLAREYR